MGEEQENRVFEDAADTAVDTEDDSTVLSKNEMIDLVRKQVNRFSSPKKDVFLQNYGSQELTRRDFLKMLGIAGSAGLGIAVGAGIIRKEDLAQTVTGYAEATDSAADVKRVNVSGRKTFSVGAGDTIQNMLLDTSSGGASANIRARGNGWKILNIGFEGQQSIGRGHALTVGGKNGEVGNVYIGDGAQSGRAIGVFVDHKNTQGPLTFNNVHISGFPNNGIYGSPTVEGLKGGIVHIKNSYFKNNKISQFKLGSPLGDCTVTNCTVIGDGAPNKRTLWALDNPGSGHNNRHKVIITDSNFKGRIVGEPGAIVELKNTRWDGQFHAGGDIHESGDPKAELRGESAGSPDLTAPEGVPENAEEAATGTATGGFGGSGGSGGESSPC